MDEWVKRALSKWPDVPALYGWLKLNRRGHWLIQGEKISNPKIISVINRNYDVDDRGCWFFQNGPQRGYMELEYAPYLIRAGVDGNLTTHNELAIERIEQVCLDEDGSIALQTDRGPGVLDDHDLGWVLSRLTRNGEPVSEEALLAALEVPSGQPSGLEMDTPSGATEVIRCDFARIPERLGFVRVPEPDEDGKPE